MVFSIWGNNGGFGFWTHSINEFGQCGHPPGKDAISNPSFGTEVGPLSHAQAVPG